MMEYMGKNGFVWWQGVVEDIYDPLKLGRIRVRILGWHTDSKLEIPTKSLPWAHVVMPVNSTSVSGKGWSPTGIVQGAWVLGFFRDGDQAQEPVVFGTIGGLNTVNIPVPDELSRELNLSNAASNPSFYMKQIEDYKKKVIEDIEKNKNDVGKKPYQLPPNPAINKKSGFSDPDGIYPLISRMGEADTNRLARGEQLENTIVKKKNDSLEICPTALYGSWTEPKSPYAARYPFNSVYESQAGHVVEYDDTPGAERMHTYHCSGTFTEIHPLGSEVHKVVANSWDITLNDKMILVKGNCCLNANKTLKILMGKDLEIEVFGDTKMLTRGDMTLDVGGNFLHKVGGTYTLASEGNMVMIAPRIDLNPEGENASSVQTFLDRARSFVNGLIERVAGISPSEISDTKTTEQPEEPPTEVTATFTEVTGKVQWRSAPGELWKSAKIGDTVFSGAEVRSGLRSTAQLKIQDKNNQGTVTVNSGTMLKVPDELPVNVNVETKISVKHGRADFKIEKVGMTNDLKVVTPSSTAAVRG